MSSAGSTKVWVTYTLVELILPPEGGGLRRYVMVGWDWELDYQQEANHHDKRQIL